MVKNPNWQEADQLAIYKRGRGVELGATEKQLLLAIRAGLEHILHTARIGMSMCRICAMKGNVMEYVKRGEQMRMMYYSVMTQANLEKEILSAPIRS